MDKTIRRFSSIEEKRPSAIREWQRLPAVMELTLEGYRMKGLVIEDVPRMQRTPVRVKATPGGDW